MHRVRRALAPALLGAALLVPSSAGAVSASQFPPGYEGFHTYAEMVADITAVQAAHPSIVRTFSIGKSYKGRTIWAAKVSDNVAVDEAEPEVMFDGLHHSDEHMSLEMTLRILHWLADGYGTDPRITDIVNTREAWIIFAVNPDGAEYDISAGRFHHWRKNRQPNAGTTAIGTDLNRNYGYRWGSGGRTSTNPAAITYEGRAAFSAPETRAVRDFLASRVVGGRQQIRASISFHEFARLVMWPYGYTTTNVPSDMTAADHDALATIGRHMASTNGYVAEQASDLYLTSGTSRDYAYGRYRIFAYTIELSAVDYPKDTKIATETGRNKEAVLYLLERAWCPLSVLGPAVRDARCGAFDDDLEVTRGWSRDPDGTDTAPAAGRFARGDQAGTTGGGTTIQPATGVIGAVRVRDRAGGGLDPALGRPRRPDDDPVAADRAARDGRPEADVPLVLRARVRLVGRGPSPRDRRGTGRDADGRVGADGVGHAHRRELAHRDRQPGRVGRPDRADPVRGAGRGRVLARRGGRGRRAGDPPDSLTTPRGRDARGRSSLQPCTERVVAGGGVGHDAGHERRGMHGPRPGPHEESRGWDCLTGARR